jgi:protein-S-isoprenylcysteine O-methyltransferase Ste14
VSRAGLLGRVAYAVLFLLVLPAGLLWWAHMTAGVVTAPAVHAPRAGWFIALVGILLIVAGAYALMVQGRGLPMNPFPPALLVRSGIYRWLRNPMYIGFVLLCAGVALASGSAAGLWLLTPTVALTVTALVYGYERHDLVRRFGPAAAQPAVLSLPRADDGPPTVGDRTAVFLLVFAPWLVLYYAVQALGRPVDAFGTQLAFERGWPVLQGTELIYASAYLFVPLTTVVIRTRQALRRFAIQSAIATVVIGVLWLVVPVVAVNRPFGPSYAWGRLLAWEQGHSQGVAAFPAFHVLWTLLAADGWTANARATGRRAWAWIAWIWATAITVSCITTGMHTVIEVMSAVVLYPPVSHYEGTWELIRKRAEQLANSWKEWRFGPVRVINHAVLAAVAAMLGILVAGSVAGSHAVPAVLWTGLCILIGSAIWAQLLEGSSRLLRPFGWYGGVLGGVFGAVTARLAGVAILPLLAAFAVAAPWIQILGRLRCLVQGCCHGGPAAAAVGIRYKHRRSRVTQLAGLADTPIHATPLYSIMGNVVIGLLLLRLRLIGASDTLLVGAYLILGGCARFVEESFRAEPQTPIIARLHSYQWVAIASVVVGAVSTALPSSPAAYPFSPLTTPLVVGAIALGIATGIAMGVDLPKSNRRFSRLASAD